ncbi:MAG: ABC transporter ATP-binding protein/permease [Oscillospiraceae bacterium]|nr:ABC transporter ATP-binding protein/permease [Oscillospiraceae bacterium]
MLRLRSIMKSYTTAGFTQNALDGVSIAFRDNEFAAVLGPSGSGKTTMLNIIGGLDRYDSGDLEIDSISTENYKAQDWDTYRNNRIGFVFQSYNLIPHQSVLSNVELALTLSGVSKSERRTRAKQVLVDVGLGDHMRKKPGQLSGGQMQRVAIARALINDPEILLADEPTGALDTTTSKQVMELLTEIAKDRLVIMVTHNNELAEKYANRLIYLTDGKVTSDTRPFDIASEDWRVGREPRKASMSFFTAIMLSFSNLMTKKGRTLTTAFAGSIGIIGIATILALSNGINTYIRNIEEETLSIYPLIIQDQGFDLSAFFGGNEDEDGDGRHIDRRQERPPDTVREMRIMETVFSTQNNNDLASLKTYLDENEQTLSGYASAIHYMYEITPQIFLSDTSDGADQINPDSIFSGMMGGADMGPQGGAGFMPGMDVFTEMPNEPSLYDTQYDILAGRWPVEYDEAVLVLGYGRRITDFALYSMGLRDRDEMRAMLESVMSRTDMEIEIAETEGFYTYDTFIGLSFKVIHPADLFQYDETFSVWVDKTGDSEFMTDLVNNGIDLKIVGIVQPNQDATATVLGMGVNYTPQLINYLMEHAASRHIVREQLANPEMNVLTGNTYADEQDNPQSRFDFSRIISVDEDLFRETLEFDFALSELDFSDLDFGAMDMSGINMGSFNMGSMSNIDFGMDGFDFSDLDLSGMDMSSIDMSGLDLSNIDMSNVPPPELDLGVLIGAMAEQVNIPAEDLSVIISFVMQDFLTTVVASDPTLLLDTDRMMAAFSLYLSNPAVQAALLEQLSHVVDSTDLEGQITQVLQEFLMTAMQTYMMMMMETIQVQMQAAMQQAMQAAMQSAMEQIMAQVIKSVTTQISEAMQSVMTSTMRQVSRQMQRAMTDMTSQIEESITSAMEEMADEIAERIQSSMEGFDGEALADAFQIEMGEDEILELMMSIMNPSVSNYEQTLNMLGYADPSVPLQILIYPRSFEAKQEILDILERYNERMEAQNEPEKVVHFTDFVGMMMSTVTTIVDMVSYALVAFVSVALVVSSIMIGVITFVSVLERKKEIGILRAVGASKGNIRLVFNAETLIIGFVAGVIGVFATFGIIIIANIILYDLLDIEQLVILPFGVPPILVAISMFLTYIAGLMPASAAARKAPVDALRSE